MKTGLKFLPKLVLVVLFSAIRPPAAVKDVLLQVFPDSEPQRNLFTGQLVEMEIFSAEQRLWKLQRRQLLPNLCPPRRGHPGLKCLEWRAPFSLTDDVIAPSLPLMQKTGWESAAVHGDLKGMSLSRVLGWCFSCESVWQKKKKKKRKTFFWASNFIKM